VRISLYILWWIKIYKVGEIINLMDDMIRVIKEKVDFFMEEKIKVHVKLQDDSFLNGFIEKELRENLYWFIDRKLQGIYLFLNDVKSIKEFVEGGEKNE